MLKAIYGNMHAETNKTMPIDNLILLSSKEPIIIKIIDKSPRITGRIWENSVVPITAILNHLLYFTFFNYLKIT